MIFSESKGEISVELGGKYIIAIIGLGVGAAILFTIGANFPSESQVREEVMRTISASDYPVCRRFSTYEKISEKDFKVITYSRSLEKCDSSSNKVQLDFTLSKSLLKEYMSNFNIQENGEPLWVFRDECTSLTGFEGFVIQGEKESEVIYNKSDYLEIKQFDGGVGLCRSDFEPVGKGERCEHGWECESDLKCNPSVYNKSEHYCCEEGKKWDGSRCISGDCGGIACDPKDCEKGCLECKGPADVCVGDGLCIRRIGENCNTSIDCGCNASTFCCPGSPESISYEGGCLPFEYANLPKGSECYCDNMCDASREYNCNPTSQNFDQYERGCCPENKVWNGNRCIKENVFRIVIVPANFEFPSDRSEYFQKANKVFNYWMNKSVFQFCSNPRERLELLTINKSCEVSPPLKDVCSGTKSSTPGMCSPQCASSVIKCARDNYPSFHKAIGVYKGDMIKSGPLKNVTGCSGLSSQATSDLGSQRGGSIHETTANFEEGVGNVHELGHDFGFCHGVGTASKRPCDPSKDANCTKISPGVGKCVSCNSSLCPNNDPFSPKDIMNYYPVDPDEKRFFNQEFKHLKNHPQLKEYLKGCSIK